MSSTNKNSINSKSEEIQVDSDPSIKCGLIMPISAIDGCSADHWAEVKNIVTDAVENINDQKFSVRLVSEADDIGVIQKRIVQNIYSSDIVICDVSGKNPNVMFELGMRLAFDKPTIIIKDDKTDYSFDTAIIEHLQYPRDLRFSRIVNFKNALCEKLLATHKASKNDPSHSTFLKNFGKFQVASLSESIVSADPYIVEMLQEMQLEISRIRRGAMREVSRKPNTEGISAIAAALSRFKSMNPSCNFSDLMGDDLFCDEMERLANAPKYFRDRSDFIDSLNDLLRQTIRIDEQAG